LHDAPELHKQSPGEPGLAQRETAMANVEPMMR
jgi:hypothetical protein